MSATETTLRAFAMFFATISPIDVAALFAVLTATASPPQRRQMAFKGSIIATAILLFFALAGTAFLRWLGISLAALQAAGGVLLLLMSVDMVFARPSGMSTPTSAEQSEAETKTDISVFPLATPLIAGPGAIAAAVLLMTETAGEILLQAIVIAALLAVMLLTYGLLCVAPWLHRLLGVTGQNVIARVIGILLAALAMQFLFDGIRGSGLVG